MWLFLIQIKYFMQHNSNTVICSVQYFLAFGQISLLGFFWYSNFSVEIMRLKTEPNDDSNSELFTRSLLIQLVLICFEEVLLNLGTPNPNTKKKQKKLKKVLSYDLYCRFHFLFFSSSRSFYNFPDILNLDNIPYPFLQATQQPIAIG